jgi:hypothetical protein
MYGHFTMLLIIKAYGSSQPFLFPFVCGEELHSTWYEVARFPFLLWEVPFTACVCACV